MGLAELLEDDGMFTSGQIQDFEDELEAQNRRRAKIGKLERQVQTLQGRLDARDAIIRSQQARIARLQQMLARQSRIVVIDQQATA